MTTKSLLAVFVLASSATAAQRGASTGRTVVQTRQAVQAPVRYQQPNYQHFRVGTSRPSSTTISRAPFPFHEPVAGQTPINSTVTTSTSTTSSYVTNTTNITTTNINVNRGGGGCCYWAGGFYLATVGYYPTYPYPGYVAPGFVYPAPVFGIGIGPRKPRASGIKLNVDGLKGKDKDVAMTGQVYFDGDYRGSVKDLLGKTLKVTPGPQEVTVTIQDDQGRQWRWDVTIRVDPSQVTPVSIPYQQPKAVPTTVAMVNQSSQTGLPGQPPPPPCIKGVTPDAVCNR